MGKMKELSDDQNYCGSIVVTETFLQPSATEHLSKYNQHVPAKSIIATEILREVVDKILVTRTNNEFPLLGISKNGGLMIGTCSMTSSDVTNPERYRVHLTNVQMDGKAYPFHCETHNSSERFLEQKQIEESASKIKVNFNLKK